MWSRAAVPALCSGMILLSACGHRRAPAANPAPQKASADSTRPLTNRTGSEDSLSDGALESRHVDDIAELLQGQVPGLQVIRSPNGDLSLLIRGGDLSLHGDSSGHLSATQSGEPLLVIDGMPVQEGQLSNTLRALNPHEIARIEVLKDVASTSVYGIRGAHGVILITMKKD